MNTLSAMINVAKNTFKAAGSAETKQFFTLLEERSSSVSALWFRGIKATIKRTTFQRAMNGGEEMDKSSPPLYSESTQHVAPNEPRVRARGFGGICRSEAHTHVRESYRWALKRAVVCDIKETPVGSLLQTSLRRGTSRARLLAASPPALFFTRGLCPRARTQIPQSKPSKLKFSAFVAGFVRHLCFFMGLGDALVLSPYVTAYNPDSVGYLCPDLQTTSSPGTKMGSYVRSVMGRDRGGTEKMDSLKVPELPDGSSAGGFRPGACNSLAAAMEAEKAIRTTGHDMRATSAFYEYLNFTRAGVQGSAGVLAGWPAMSWGRNGPGPVAMSLTPLDSIDRVSLDRVIDELFRLDSASSPSFMVGGAQRPIISAAFGALVMHYEDREKAGEMTKVLARMREIWKGVFRPSSGDLDGIRDAHLTLVAWGSLIRAEFDVSNLHLTAPVREGSDSSAAVATAISGLQRAIVSQTRVAQVESNSNAQLRLEVGEVRRELSTLRTELRAGGVANGAAPGDGGVRVGAEAERRCELGDGGVRVGEQRFGKRAAVRVERAADRRAVLVEAREAAAAR